MNEVDSPVGELSDARLEGELSSLIEPGLSIQTRSHSFWTSTHHVEEVTMDTSGGSVDLICKYGPTSVDPLTGHRRGVPYEAAVYEHVFPDASLPTPACRGSFPLDDSTSCLVLEKVPGERISHFADPPELVGLIRRLARFHRSGSGILPRAHNVFDRPYFLRVAGEIAEVERIPARLDTSLADVIEVLRSVPKTTIHGELYPHDVILGESGPVVLDWESAGAGPGAFDVAVLIQGSWDRALLAECEETYLDSSGGDPTGSRAGMAAARIWAAALLLVHLRRQETDGRQEEIAVETIADQLEIFSSWV